MFQPATDRQVSYIVSLQARAGVSAGVPAQLTSAQASALIEELKGLAASAAAAVSTALVGEGVYRRSTDGAMFRVQTSRESGNRYAKTLLESGGWGYERGAIFTLKPEERLSVGELAEWGLSTGVCAICARLLSTAESVARGIGPVCASRY
jgi:hypothetical protein